MYKLFICNSNNIKTEFSVAPGGDLPVFQFSKVRFKNLAKYVMPKTFHTENCNHYCLLKFARLNLFYGLTTI